MALFYFILLVKHNRGGSRLSFVVLRPPMMILEIFGASHARGPGGIPSLSDTTNMEHLHFPHQEAPLLGKSTVVTQVNVIICFHKSPKIKLCKKPVAMLFQCCLPPCFHAQVTQLLCGSRYSADSTCQILQITCMPVPFPEYKTAYSGLPSTAGELR